MSPSYSVLPTMEGGPQNGPVPVKVYRDAPFVVERTAIWLPSPTATTPPEVPVTPPITKPSVKQCCQMRAPVDRSKAFTVPEHVALERVKDAVLVDHTDKWRRLPSDNAVEKRRSRPEVGVVLLLCQGNRPRAHQAQVRSAHLVH